MFVTVDGAWDCHGHCAKNCVDVLSVETGEIFIFHENCDFHQVYEAWS